MTDQELIYQITKAVYNRLGAAADKELVENLVMDVYRIVQNSGRGKQRQAEAEPSKRDDHVVISAFGVSRPGIVAAITSALAEAQYDIVDMNQTVVQGKFAMVLIADARYATTDLSTLKLHLKEVGDRVGVRIYAQREDIFHSMHRV
jgi:ACT domain-containing protein